MLILLPYSRVIINRIAELPWIIAVITVEPAVQRFPCESAWEWGAWVMINSESSELKQIVCIYNIYSSLQKNWALDIYQYIHLSSDCGKGSTRKVTSRQTNLDKHAIYSIYWAGISSCGYMLMIFVCPGMFSKTKTFPQCTPYMYILIYIKGSKVLQTAVYIYMMVILVHVKRSRFVD